MKPQDDAPDESADDLYADLERRALFDMPEEEPGEDDAPDLIGSITGEVVDESQDVTLGGYIAKHDRVPAFEGADGQPYTVDIDVEHIDEGDVADDAVFAAFLIFIRWAATGAGIMDHAESGNIAFGATEEDARRAALDLSLYEVKAELDAAIARRASLEE
jgi:hypothetical protein